MHAYHRKRINEVAVNSVQRARVVIRRSAYSSKINGLKIKKIEIERKTQFWEQKKKPKWEKVCFVCVSNEGYIKKQKIKN